MDDNACKVELERNAQLDHGFKAAQTAITEALMATLLAAQPQLAEPMRQQLLAAADLQRQLLQAPEDATALEAMEYQIASAHRLLDVFSGG